MSDICFVKKNRILFSDVTWETVDFDTINDDQDLCNIKQEFEDVESGNITRRYMYAQQNIREQVKYQVNNLIFHVTPGSVFKP